MPLRLVVGYGFAAHGYAKLARGVGNFENILSAIGIPAPGAMAWITSLLEFVGGICVLCGAWLVPLCAPLATIMVTAMFGVHFRYGFSSIRLKGMTAAGAQFGPVGYELNLFYLAALLTLALSPTTALSLDRWLESRRASKLPQRSAT